MTRKSITVLGIAGACTALVTLTLPPSVAAPRGGDRAGAGITDVALCQLVNTRSWGRVGDIHAYSIRTDTWNTGDEILVWEEFTPEHPVMAQNLYRYHDGRLEMIGLSWVKHGFCALQLLGCGECEVEPGCPNYLKPGCRDPYSANLNGNQLRLGPRSEINASTAEFPYPYNLNWQQTGDAVFKRLQVHDDDLNPALNKGARYYIEGQILHPQEGTTPQRHNNATYEEVVPVPEGNTYELGDGMDTVAFLPAIYAWQDNDSAVVIEAVDVPGEPVDGRFFVGFRVFANGDGTWRYEYAVQNLNSHRSASGFSVPLFDNVSISDTFHRDVKYHSGEPYTNEDWTLSIDDDSVEWSGVAFNTNENANALRWGTMFNFAFTADTPPMWRDATIDLFRPGTIGDVHVTVLAPRPFNNCPANLNGDGMVDVLDLLILLDQWGPCLGCLADINGDGTVDVLDLLILLDAWGPCPSK